MDNLKLLGLQRAEYEVAENKLNTAGKVQFIIVAVSIIAISTSHTWIVYLGSILNLFLVFVWQLLAYQGRKSHHIAERARRMVVLSEGLGIQISGKQYSDIRMQFTVSPSDGKKHENQNYYKANESPGNARLAEMLQESAFWSKHLLDRSSSRYWLLFVVTLLSAFVGLLLLYSVPNLLIVQIFSVLLIWLITGGLFSDALKFTIAARAIDDVENRLDGYLSAQSLDKDLLVILGDYNAIVQEIPTIPSSIYYSLRDKLNKLWIESRKANNK